MKNIAKCVIAFLLVSAVAEEVKSLIDGIREADSTFFKGVSLWVKNGDEASKYLKEACDNSKHPGACVYLGNYYEIKSAQSTIASPTSQNEQLENATKYYKIGYDNSIEACKEGAVEWCTLQAVALIDGRGVERDVAKGLEFLDIMCEKDIENACFTLGSYYFYGINVAKDLERAKALNLKALELDSKACEEHRMYACVISAEMYQQGLSVAQDLDKAKDYYRQACALRNQFACDYAGRLK